MTGQSDMLDLLHASAPKTAASNKKFPTPWIVGPFGCIWVAADVEFKGGKWHETCAEPRLVVDTGTKDIELAQFIVDSANAYAVSSQKHSGEIS